MSDELNEGQAPQGPVTSRRKMQIEKSMLRKVLVALGEFIVPPLTIVTIVCQYKDIPAKRCAEVSVIVLVLEAMLIAGWYVRSKRVWVPLLVGLAWALVIILAVALVSSYRDIDKLQGMDTWNNWKASLSQSVEACQKQKDDEMCLAQLLSRITPPHQALAGASTPMARLSVDLHEGLLISSFPSIQNLLYDRLGVNQTFLATGFSEPHGTTDYWAARLPEYLVPNYPDSNSQVWTWELESNSNQLKRQLADVIQHETPNQANARKRTNARDFKSALKSIRDNLDLNDDTPAVVRFAQLSEKEYSDCMGRRGASRVFASHLGEAWRMNLTVKQAAAYSGYTFGPYTVDRQKRLFIWVFLPTHPEEAVSPTWTQMLPRMARFVAERNLCPRQ